MTHTMIWFGSMTHDMLPIDDLPIVIIHSIDKKIIMDPDDVEEHMISQSYDSYVIPDEFKGLITFSTQFMKGLAK